MDFRRFLILLLIAVKKNFCDILNNHCVRYAGDINLHHPIENNESPNPIGKWISSRCEVIPNGRFVIRRFDITESKWNGFFYHYSDSWCTKPEFIIKVTGTYDVSLATATTNSKGAMASNFKFEKIVVRTNQAAILEQLINTIERDCPTALPEFQKMQDKKVFEVDKYLNQDIQLSAHAYYKKRCRYYFALHQNSYKKIRMVTDKTKVQTTIIGRSLSKYDTLFFADIPPIHAKSKTYPYKKFQYGLSRINRPDCNVCTLARKMDNNVNKHPILTAPTSQVEYAGEWVSPTCEMSDSLTFVTRYYKISPKIQGKIYGSIMTITTYYNDQDCKDKQFAFVIGGIYSDPSGRDAAYKFDGILNFNIEFTSLAVVPYDEEIMRLVQSETSCGDPSKWKYGHAQNVTSSKGCRAFGLTLPIKVMVVGRVGQNSRKRELYIEQIDNESQKGSYFTKSLVSCKTISQNITNIETTLEPTRRRIITIDPDFFKKPTKDLNGSSMVDGVQIRWLLTFLIFSLVYVFS